MQNHHTPDRESSRVNGDAPMGADTGAGPAHVHPNGTGGADAADLPYAAVAPPRAFLLFPDGLDPDDYYPEDGSIDSELVVGWGAAFDGQAMVRLCESVEPSLPSAFESAESACRLFSRALGPLRIIWA